MNKKLLIALTSLALVLSAVALGLWWTVKGKNELAMKSTSVLSPRFAKESFESRMAGVGKAHQELTTAEKKVADLTEDVAAKESTIASRDKKIKDLEGNVSDLETQRADLTRTKDELQGKVDNLQSKATTAENKVKELEEQIVKSAEESQKKIDDLQAKLDGDKGTLQKQAQEARGFYSRLYNFVTSRGMRVDMPERPWETGKTATQSGPMFAANSLVAEIVDIDTRLGFVVLNVGGDAGLLRDQGFEVFVNDQSVGKLRIGDVLNGSVSSGYLLKDTDLTKLSKGAPIKLIPLGGQ